MNTAQSVIHRPALTLVIQLTRSIVILTPLQISQGGVPCNLSQYCDTAIRINIYQMRNIFSGLCLRLGLATHARYAAHSQLCCQIETKQLKEVLAS